MAVKRLWLLYSLVSMKNVLRLVKMTRALATMPFIMEKNKTTSYILL